MAAGAPALISTARLALNELTLDDAEFILRLFNDPDFIRHIGDRNIHDLDAAGQYLVTGPQRMYAVHGFGLYRVACSTSGEPLGICGLIKRDWLQDVDLGFAFLPEHRARGYALEAAAATLAHGFTQLGLRRIVAITDLDNHRSIRLLERLGMRFEKLVQGPGAREPLRLFAAAAPGVTAAAHAT